MHQLNLHRQSRPAQHNTVQTVQTWQLATAAEPVTPPHRQLSTASHTQQACDHSHPASEPTLHSRLVEFGVLQNLCSSVVCNTPASFSQHNSQGSCHHWRHMGSLAGGCLVKHDENAEIRRARRFSQSTHPKAPIHSLGPYGHASAAAAAAVAALVATRATCNHRCSYVAVMADTIRGHWCAAQLTLLLLGCPPQPMLPDWADAFGCLGRGLSRCCAVTRYCE